MLFFYEESMSLYVRLCKSVHDKGRLLKPEEINQYIDDKTDWYVSTYFYNEAQKKLFDEIGSIKGIANVFTDNIWFDFDNQTEEQLLQDSAKVDCLKTIERLKQEGLKESDVELYFTGNKGYTFTVNVNKSLSPAQVKHLCRKFAGDLPTFDKSLYDASQIIRIPFTKHQDSRLYKIPITVEQLKKLTRKEIRDMAKDLNGIKDNLAYTQASLKDDLFKIPELVKESPTASAEVDWNKKPGKWRNCKWAILQGEIPKGQRNEALMVLCSTLRGLGFDKETAYYMCKSSLYKSYDKYGEGGTSKEELWNNIVGQVYSEGWGGGTYSCKKEGTWLYDYCQSLGDNRCKEKDDENRILMLHDIESSFIEYVKNIEENTIKTGLEDLDKIMPLTTGMNCGIIGSPGSGKTSLVLEILKHTSKQNVVSVFASLDMHRNRVFEKLLYKVSNGKSREEVYKMFKDGQYQELVQKIKEDYPSVFFFDRSSPSVDDVRAYIEEINEASDKKVKLVVLDYFERVSAEKSDDTAASKEVAGKLQDLVNDFNICLITLVQPNKFSLSGGVDKPIRDYTAIKGSSFLYQSFRAILSIWRPFMTPDTPQRDKYMQMAVLKNDLGELATLAYSFEGKTGRIAKLLPYQEEELSQWLMEKNNDGEENGWD